MPREREKVWGQHLQNHSLVAVNCLSLLHQLVKDYCFLSGQVDPIQRCGWLSYTVMIKNTPYFTIWSKPTNLEICTEYLTMQLQSKIYHSWMNEFIFLSLTLTWISRSLILVPRWRSRLLSSFSSFCTNSAVALFFWVRRVAQIALYSNVLSSLGFPEGLFISPTRTPRSVFCSRTNRT